MFGLGTTELLVILGLALLVFGPSKLPELATSLGRAIRSFRKATNDLQDQLELDENVKRPINELKSALRDEPPPSSPPKPAPAATATSTAGPAPAPAKPIPTPLQVRPVETPVGPAVDDPSIKKE